MSEPIQINRDLFVRYQSLMRDLYQLGNQALEDEQALAQYSAKLREQDEIDTQLKTLGLRIDYMTGDYSTSGQKLLVIMPYPCLSVTGE